MIWRMASFAFLTGAAMIAQVPSPKFASAAIRSSQEVDGPSRYFTDREKIRFQNQTLKDCVRIAYDVKVAQLAGGAPKWIETQRFDIDARAASVLDDREMKAMLRALLLERFGLALHGETKMFPGYALIGGQSRHEDSAVPPGPSRIGTRRGSVTGENVSMATLAQALSDVMNKPVVDQTKAPGVFTSRSNGPRTPCSPAP